MKIKFWRIFPVVFGILLLSFFVNSQIKESGEIQGYVTDQEGEPFPGAIVTIESPDLIGGAQSQATDAKGFYRFRSLSVGEYKVTAELAGFNTMIKEGIDLHARMTLACDFKMIQTTVEEEVIVVAEIPTIDTKSSQPKPIIMTDEFLIALPGKTSWSQLISLAPGVSQTYSTVGNAWQHDGVDVSYPFNGMAGFNPDIRIIKEASVQNLGLPAEYGHFTGSVLSTVSKSGSNKYSTFTEFRYNGKKWNSQNWEQVPEDEWYYRYKPDSDYQYATNPFYDISAQFGGKIIHDRLWFFIAGEYSKAQTPILNVEKTKDDKYSKGFVKFTFQLNPSNKFNASGNWHRRMRTNGGISANNPVIGVDYKYPGLYANLNWTSIFSPTTFLDVKAGYNYTSTQNTPNQGLDVIGGRDYFLGTYVGNYYDSTATSTWAYQTSAHLSHYIDDFLNGSHDIKIGGEFIHYKILWDRKAPGDRIEHYWDGVPYRAQDRLRWQQDLYSNMFVGFIQDRWTLTKRLTLNLGLRLDYNRFYFPSESSTRGTVYSNPALAPRLGITYDLLGDRKNIVKLNYSHYFEGMQRGWFGNMEHRYEGGASYNWDATKGEWVLISQPPALEDPDPIPVDTDISQPMIREISGAFERELFRDASISISFWYRTLAHSMQVVDVGAIFEPYIITNPGPDGRVGTADDGGAITGYTWVNRYSAARQYALINPEAGNPSWLAEDYKWKDRGIEIRFNKRFSKRWQMMASYMYYKVTGNVTGAFPGGIYDPNRAINAYGERGYLQPHQFKLQGNVLLPLDISLSAIFNLQSGRFLDSTFVGKIPGISYALIYPETLGTNQAGATNNLDLKLEKQFRYKGATLGISLDIFNATNNHDDKGYYYTRYGPIFGYRTGVKTPRTFIMGIRIIY